MEENQYKSTDNRLMQQIKSDLEANLEKFKDPIVLGEIAYSLLQERENTNRLLKSINQRLDALGYGSAVKESGARAAEQAAPSGIPEFAQKAFVEPLLPEVDEQILIFVKKSGKATAEHVQKEFNYKGKNGACARLNRLCDMSLLNKKQVGKKVFFFPE